MKIGIDSRLYSNHTGLGRYVRNLIKNLEIIDQSNEYIIFCDKEGNEEYHPSNKNFKKWIVNTPIYSINEQFSLLLEFSRARLDVLHVPHINAPVFYPSDFILTVHDLTMHDYKDSDDSTKSQSEQIMKKYGYRYVSERSIVKANKIIVPTNSVKEEILSKIKNVNGEKIFVTYEGLDLSLLNFKSDDERSIKTKLEGMRINKPYILYVGSVYAHKNIKNLIITYNELVTKYDLNLQFVIAGQIDKSMEQVASFVHGLNLEQDIIFPARYAENNRRYVSDEDLATLYSGAQFFINPSLKEGFSITPLEAQAFGVPVLLSDIPTHREVFGDSAYYFNAESLTEMADNLLNVLKNPDISINLINKGNENIKKYSWEKMAKETLNVYDSFKH
jgi:glycosyltransferase involved in cell wall biosynthesis